MGPCPTINTAPFDVTQFDGDKGVTLYNHLVHEEVAKNGLNCGEYKFTRLTSKNASLWTFHHVFNIKLSTMEKDLKGEKFIHDDTDVAVLNPSTPGLFKGFAKETLLEEHEHEDLNDVHNSTYYILDQGANHLSVGRCNQEHRKYHTFDTMVLLKDTKKADTNEYYLQRIRATGLHGNYTKPESFKVVDHDCDKS
jgi:hypothetical protein